MAKHCLRMKKVHGKKVCARYSGKHAKHGKKSHKLARRHYRGMSGCAGGHCGGLVAMPAIGSFGFEFFERPVKSMDVLAGAGIGSAAALALKAGLVALSKPGTDGKAPLIGADGKNYIPDFIAQLLPALGAFASGGIAIALQMKGNAMRGQGHLLGALSAGLGMATQSVAHAQAPQYFGGLVAMPAIGGYSDIYRRQIAGGYSDVHVQNPYGDVLVRNPGPQMIAEYADAPQLAGVMSAAMGDDSGEDVGDEINMLASMYGNRR